MVAPRRDVTEDRSSPVSARDSPQISRPIIRYGKRLPEDRRRVFRAKSPIGIIFRGKRRVPILMNRRTIAVRIRGSASGNDV